MTISGVHCHHYGIAEREGREKVGMDRCQGLTRALMVPRLSSFIIPITDQSFRQEEQ